MIIKLKNNYIKYNILFIFYILPTLIIFKKFLYICYFITIFYLAFKNLIILSFPFLIDLFDSILNFLFPIVHCMESESIINNINTDSPEYIFIKEEIMDKYFDDSFLGEFFTGHYLIASDFISYQKIKGSEITDLCDNLTREHERLFNIYQKICSILYEKNLKKQFENNILYDYFHELLIFIEKSEYLLNSTLLKLYKIKLFQDDLKINNSISIEYINSFEKFKIFLEELKNQTYNNLEIIDKNEDTFEILNLKSPDFKDSLLNSDIKILLKKIKKQNLEIMENSENLIIFKKIKSHILINSFKHYFIENLDELFPDSTFSPKKDNILNYSDYYNFLEETKRPNIEISNFSSNTLENNKPFKKLKLLICEEEEEKKN